jgi:alkylation response protein AidB-like acyl-CoA dehydrogenase
MFKHFLNEDQLMLLESVKKFALKEVVPQAAEADAKAEFNRPLYKKIAELGLMGIAFSPEYDGAGQGYITTALVIAELAKACGATGMTVAAHYLGAHTLEDFGSPEQKAKYLPAIARGEMLAAFALTEPGAGSDVAAIRTSAKKQGNNYVLNGNKIFITNGGEAEFYAVFAKTDPEKGVKGISAFIVEKGTPGFSFGKKEDKMGMRGSVNREVIFENCVIPEENRIGKEGEGFKIAMKALDAGRIVTAAYALGVAEAALAASVDYSKGRVQFKQPICEFQAVQFMLADMKVGIDSARLLIYNAAFKADQGIPYGLEASQAKLVASDVAMSVTTDAVQILGGYGYMQEYPVERFMRDAKLTQILEGTNQIQRVIISKQILRD